MLPLDQIAHVGVNPSINLKLISREIIFEVFQRVKTENHTWTSQTDRRTDRRTTYCCITALSVASRDKKCKQKFPRGMQSGVCYAIIERGTVLAHRYLSDPGAVLSWGRGICPRFTLCLQMSSDLICPYLHFYSLSTLATIVAKFGDCRQNRRLSPNSATVAKNGDCRRTPKPSTVAEFGDKLSPKSATIVSSVDRALRKFPLFVTYSMPRMHLSIQRLSPTAKLLMISEDMQCHQLTKIIVYHSRH